MTPNKKTHKDIPPTGTTTNLQKVIQNKTKELLAQYFSTCVEFNIGTWEFYPEEWQPNWGLLAEEVITSEEVIEASEKYAEEYGKSVLTQVKEKEREYQENN